MHPPSHHALLNRSLSPLKRRALLTWFFEKHPHSIHRLPQSVPQQHTPASPAKTKLQHSSRCLYHPAFIRCLTEAQRRQTWDKLNTLHSKIAFMLIYELGPEVALNRSVYHTLIQQVAQRLEA